MRPIHRALVLAASAAILFLLASPASAQPQSGSMAVYAGLNTVQDHISSTATPDPTIAVGTLDYCEHVNSGYQCWYKSGANANQPINFLGGTSVKSDAGPWSQNNNNSGNTPNCPTAFSPNSQILHDNVYNLWIMEKRITSTGNGHNYMCVAISNLEDISSPSFSWFAFEYDLDTVIPTNTQGNFFYPDYPQTGLWQSSTRTTPPYTAASDQALWITYDLLNPNASDNIEGVLICAIDLAGLRNSTASPYNNASQTPACTVAHPLTSFNQRRSWVPANNSDTKPPISADGEMFTYMIEPAKSNKGTTSYLTDPNHTQGVEQWTINWNAGTPTPSSVASWDLPSTQANGDQLGCFNPSNYYDTICIPQPSTGTTGILIDSVADRMQQFFHYTSNGGQGSIWTSVHTIQIVPNASSNTQTEADVRLLQRSATSPNPVYVAADYPVVDPVDSDAYVFLPSVVRDQAGNLQGILGVSGSGADEHPGLDSWNFVPGTATSSTWGYIASPLTDGDAEDTDNLNFRWGDWSSAVLDPSDSCTVWVAGEYLAANRTTEPYWYTGLAQLPPLSSCLAYATSATLSHATLNFGTQPVGVPSATLLETVTNNQSTALNISGINATGDFYQTNTCQQPLAPHGTCTISVYFTPSTTGTRTGTLNVIDNAANSPQTAALTGVGSTSSVSIGLSPASLAFGSQIWNTTGAAKSITVTNTGAVNLTVRSIAASGDYAESDNCTQINLAPSATCTINVTFTPTVIGSVPGTLTLNDTAVGSPHLITLSGTGQAVVSLSANLTFVTTNVGSTSAAQTMTLTNHQSQAFTFTSAISGDFLAQGGSTSPCNGTLAAKASCSFAIRFAPTTNGTIKGALTITATPGTTPAVVGGLTGTGAGGATPPFTFTPVTLSFGDLVLNSSVTKTVTLKNAGSTGASISLTGAGYFAVAPGVSHPCGSSLAAKASCTFNVTFTPPSAGAAVGSVTLTDNLSTQNTQVLNATGTGVLAVTVAPASLSFGTVSVGDTSAVQSVTVTNNTSAAVSLSSVAASGGFISTSGGTSPCGGNIPANGSCTLGVEFSPTVSGAATGTLTIRYGGASSPQEVSLTGTGH
jgi:hypothetical protein